MKETLITIVTEVLADNPKARDNDQYMICKVWHAMHREKFFGINKKTAVFVSSIVDVFEKSESITRARRTVQNTLGLFPPTKLSIALHRRIAEEKWREMCKHNFSKTHALKIAKTYENALKSK